MMTPRPTREPRSRVPQTSPLAAYQSHAAEIEAALARVLASGRYLLGPETTAFEQEFAAWVGVEHAVTCASGTDALHLALRACGIGPGDEVITVSHTAVATVSAIELCGATPVMVDIEPASFNLDPSQLPGALTDRTRAVVTVHLYGRAADLAAIQTFCEIHGLRLIEDCSQAHGAMVEMGAGGEQKVGSLGDLAAFSFYPTKNLGALGDGGAVVTRDSALAETVRSLRQYGWRKERYVSEESGWNGRLDELQAAVLRVKLRTLDADNSRRAALAARYSERLVSVAGLTLPAPPAHGRCVWHQYVIRSDRREALAAHLHAAGIDTLVHYPVPIHLQPAYAGRALARAPLPHTERAAREVLSLPMFPELEEIAACAVIATVADFFAQ